MAVKVLHLVCQQIWKTQQWRQDWKRLVFISIPKKGISKECSNYHTIALISHASKVTLKILQVRLQQYMKQELPDVEAGNLGAEEILGFSGGSDSKEPTCNAGAAAAAKSLQLCPTVCNPIDGSPPGSPVPGILQAITLEWVAISFSNAWKWKVKGKSPSHVPLTATPWTVAHQAPLCMGFSRQVYCSGEPFPSPEMQETRGSIPGFSWSPGEENGTPL